MIRIVRAVADLLGRYERHRCTKPGCDFQIRFCGVSDTEAKRLRERAAEHLQRHAS